MIVLAMSYLIIVLLNVHYFNEILRFVQGCFPVRQAPAPAGNTSITRLTEQIFMQFLHYLFRIITWYH